MDLDREAQREQDRMRRALGVKLNKEPEKTKQPIFGAPVKVRKAGATMSFWSGTGSICDKALFTVREE